METDRKQPPRVALVTGANRGLGYEIARQLARIGHSVTIGSRTASKAEAAVASLAGEGLTLSWVALDVNDESSVSSAIADVVARHGSIDILVNNAGILIDGPDPHAASVLHLSAERLVASLTTNTIGPFLTMKAVLPGMRQRGFGRIVNVSSRAGQLEDFRAGIPSYRVSKTALNSLTRVTAAEFRNDDIKINCMCPGWVRTDMGGASAPLSAAEGADTAIWLATLPSDGPTGQFFRARTQLAW